MILKKFRARDGKVVVLRTLENKDLRRVREFCDYLNSIIAEKDFILFKKPVKPDFEREALKRWLGRMKKKDMVSVIAESDGKVIGVADVSRKFGAMDHVSVLGISIRKEYRGAGVGLAVMGECIKAAKRLKTKMIQLHVFSTNKRAIALYKKFGFRKVAEIPKDVQRRGKLISGIIMMKDL
jgi:ribosomal protein S18 acetylase RimI-like enzyme